MGGIVEVLGKDGVLSRRISGFRERGQQLAMAEAVRGAIQADRPLMVEAPTGVGKSFAYLVPSLLEAVDAGKRVILATHTIALQEQLLERDLPLLDASLPVECTAAKAVGRANYLSLRRLDQALINAPLLFSGEEEVRELRRLQKWSQNSSGGLRQELEPQPIRAWDAVQSEGDNCLGRRCATFESCFFHGARRRVENADLIVTNHALFFLDLRLQEEGLGLLPPADVVILDEAHHISRVARQSFGLELSERWVLRTLQRLAVPGRAQGLIYTLPEVHRKQLLPLIREGRSSARLFFDDLAGYLEVEAASNGRIRQPEFIDNLLSDRLSELGEGLVRAIETSDSEEESVELSAAASRIEGLASEGRALLRVDDPELVYYGEAAPQMRDRRLCARPVDVGETLKEHLFSKTGCVVLTSATLFPMGAGQSRPKFSAETLGCPDAELLALDSPFDHGQVELHVPKELPSVDDPGFPASAAKVIEDYVGVSRGGAFILCTSYRSLEALHRLTASSLGRQGYCVLRQGGSLDRSRLLERFREDGNAVLFGADSFWEGVDVPGPALRLVIITRLPFPVPTLPMNEARVEAIKKRGGSPFKEFFLPEALLRFRQGFGRLIRKEDDEGRVVCLDRRIVEKSYGAAFRRALPGCRWVTTKGPGPAHPNLGS